MMKNNADHETQLQQFRVEHNFDFVAIALVEPAENQYVLKWKYTSGNLSNRIKKVVLHSGKGIAGTVFKTGKPLMIKNRSEFEQREDLFNYPILVFENLRSMGAVPIWHNGRVAGVLLGGYREADRMSDEKLQILIQTAAKGIGNLDGKELMLN